MSVIRYQEFPGEPGDWLPDGQEPIWLSPDVVIGTGTTQPDSRYVTETDIVQQRTSPEWDYCAMPAETPAIANLVQSLDPKMQQFIAELAEDLQPDTQERLVESYMQLPATRQAEVSEYYQGMEPGSQYLIRHRLAVEDALGAVSMQKHLVETQFQQAVAERCRQANEGRAVDSQDESFQALYRETDLAGRQYAQVAEDIIAVETEIMHSGARSAPFLELTVRRTGPAQY